ncbi:MAG: outer membrane protein assembly factor BamA [Epsilonproteobacteria bacterium]|nr:MAG: outer membrane protein assembly factor BamA [Campylobacterota bacterium]
MYKKIILTLIISLNIFASQTFKEIKFEGLTQISNEVALETANFKNNQYTIEKTNQVIKEFHNFNYFQNIWITDENSTLTIHFTEKPFIAKLEMTGYKNRDDDLKMLYDSMGIKKGTMYTKAKLNRAKEALLLALEREGYINSVVEVEVENINKTSVAIKFNVNKGDEITITNIKFKGAKALDVDDFEDIISNKESDCCFTWFFGQNNGEISFEQLKFDSHRIKDLYLQNGYLDAKVTAAYSKVDFNTNTAEIEYTIIEGIQYKVNDTIIYLDEKILKVENIYPELKLEKDDIFNISHLRKDQEYIKTQVANKGYAFTQVKFDIKPNKKNRTLDIVYNVIAGDKVYINDVIISGNSRTLDRVIRRNIYLAPNDLYSLTDFKDSKNALKRTGFFEIIDIQQKRVSSDKMDLIVKVTEAPTGNLILGGGYGSYDGWMINASVNDKNIFGSGLNLGFSFENSSKSTSYKISLANPAINDSKYNGSINIHKNDYLVTSTDTTIGDKNTLEEGFGLGIGRSLSRHTRVGTNYAYDTTDVTYSVDTTLNSRFITSSITPYISFNNTDDYFIPREGITTGTSLKYSGLGGDAKYMLSSTYFKYYYSLEDLTDYDIILRYKNNLKSIINNGNIPDDTTFYLGGPSSVRGYSSYAFQPTDTKTPFKRYFTNSVELSFPLIPSAKMRWALFYDYGIIGEEKFNQIEKVGRGIVIAWYSPVGPLQFIFSRAVNPDAGDRTSNFEFSLGTKF